MQLIATADSAASGVFRRIQALLWPFRENSDLFRATIISHALGWLAVIALLPDQGVEAVRVAAENGVAGDPMQFILMIVTASLAAAATWYWARLGLYLFAPWDDAEKHWSRRRIRLWRHLPRAIGMLPLAGLPALPFGSGVCPVRSSS